MEISNLTLGHTLHVVTEELSGIQHDYLHANSEIKYWAVELKICGGHEIHEFTDLNSILEHSRNHKLVYRFIEYTDNESNRKVKVLHLSKNSDMVMCYQNNYGIGGDWKLFINSKHDIVVQHMLFPKTDITERYRDFPSGKDFYLYLASLIYILTNYKLETAKEIRETFINVCKCIIT